MKRKIKRIWDKNLTIKKKKITWGGGGGGEIDRVRAKLATREESGATESERSYFYRTLWYLKGPVRQS